MYIKTYGKIYSFRYFFSVVVGNMNLGFYVRACAYENTRLENSLHAVLYTEERLYQQYVLITKRLLADHYIESSSWLDLTTPPEPKNDDLTERYY